MSSARIHHKVVVLFSFAQIKFRFTCPECGRVVYYYKNLILLRVIVFLRSWFNEGEEAIFTV